MRAPYSHAAAKAYFGEDADLYHVPEFEDTMKEVEEGRADYAVLPIENSTAGFVINNYDLLLKYKNYIVGEIYVPVAHMLLGVPVQSSPISRQSIPTPRRCPSSVSLCP